MKLKRWGLLTIIAAVFAGGVKAGVEYAKSHYVVRDRKFIEGKIIDKED